MGHVPSKDVSSKPFLADLQTAKGHVDRLVIVALTRDNFRSVDDPLFQQFIQLRCDPSVLHWFNVQDPANRTALPPVPAPEYLYEKHVKEISDLIEKGVDPKEYYPIPIAMFRLVRGSKSNTQILDQAASTTAVSGGGASSGATIHDILASGEQVQMVGYLGCRGPNHKVGPILSVFLDKSFWNEAKSISIFQIGCKCYEHFIPFCNGVPGPVWPTELRARCLDTNLPTLRLIQKICREYEDAIVTEADGGGVTVDHSGPRVCLAADPKTLVQICGALASSVSSETFPGTQIHRRFRLKTQTSANGTTPPTTPFDDIVEHAKARWNESNALVVSAKKKEAAAQAAQAASQRSSAGGTNQTGSESGTPTTNSPASVSLSPNGVIPGGVVTTAGNVLNPTGGAGVSANSLPGVQQRNTPSSSSNASQSGAPIIAAGANAAAANAAFGVGGGVSSSAPGSASSSTNWPVHSFQQFNQQNSVSQSQPQMTVQQNVAPTTAPSDPKIIKLPFQVQATILIPTASPGVLQPFPVQWSETGLEFKPSSQRSQHPGMLLEVAKRPESGSISVIGVNGPMNFVLPDPCYVNINPGTPVFVQM